MSVVDIDRTKPYTKEIEFSIFLILGLGYEALRELLPPEEYAEYIKWENKNHGRSYKHWKMIEKRQQN